MACLRCGSAWKTRWGKDKLSCPECCKQQRAKARRLGHLPSSQTKVCERCGEQFEAVGGNAIAHMTCCPKCRDEKAACRDRKKRYQERVKAGLVVPKKRSEPQPERKCLRCGIVMRRKQQVKYCSNACFIADRNDGVQQWNREGQVNANLRRCGISMLPSQVGLRLVRSGFYGFMAKLRAFQKRIARLYCPTCGAFVERNASPFCSDECSRKFEFETTCHRCGCSTKSKGYMGSGRRTCEACKQAAERKARRAARRKYGKHYRSRARYHGVKYVAFPVRDIFERDGYRCQICRKRVFEKARYRKGDGKIHPLSPTIDHIVPMCKGGNHEPSNCQTACFQCNSRKGDSGGWQLRLAISSGPTYQGGRKSGRGT